MRPKSIVLFERLVLLQLLIGIVNTVLLWDRLSAQIATTGMGDNGLIITQTLTVALFLLLVYFISRRGSPIAKWIYVVLAGLSLAVGLAGIGAAFELGALSGVATVISYLLTAISIVLLFRPDAKAWFADGRGEAHDADFVK